MQGGLGNWGIAAYREVSGWTFGCGGECGWMVVLWSQWRAVVISGLREVWSTSGGS